MDKYEIKNNNGDIWYLKNGVIYRDNDLPARESNHTKVWYKDGLIHREGDLPAMIEEDTKAWYKEGLMHRDNGLPAIIIKDGQKQIWYESGKKHRIGKPALIEWIKKGECILLPLGWS